MAELLKAWICASVGLAATSLFGCSGGAPANPASQTQAEAASAEQAANTEPRMGLTVQEEPFGSVDGKSITRYLLSNDNGMSVAILSYGAIVQSVSVPDRKGESANVTLGFDELQGYTGPDPYFGAICGRYSNRIAKGKFTLGGTEYTLATNNGPNHLHGGKKGYNEAVWQSRPLSNEMTEGEAVGVELKYTSPDGEEGYPGTLNVTVVYTLNDKNELKIEYTATTDKPTPINLTNHAYWNLRGVAPGEAEDVLEHVLTLNCDRYLPVDETLIPTGVLKPVKGTAMDFREPRPIGSRIDHVEGGYDHCYVINGEQGELRLAARVYEPSTGRVMEVRTTEPGVQFYTGNFLNGSAENGGFQKHEGFCLECQHFPDSPNQREFPGTVLEPGRVYKQTTVHAFSVRDEK